MFPQKGAPCSSFWQTVSRFTCCSFSSWRLGRPSPSCATPTAVLFGVMYGEAKYLAVRRHRIGSALCVAVGFALSALLHGLYDATAMLAGYGDGTFLLVVAVIYAIVFPVVRAAAKHDRRFA